ncbi:Hypothetical protein CulFRC11_1377 [Corynebacterium ramonii]|uniref:Uncharacterized protein n=1 Tax=Corynebacterium ramonii TaxID=3026968 RepID=A0ABN4EHC5_9CORY|nr:Hypothetical protein CulFRC11_1377 [Corynebacterium ramonii FRC0011]ESU58132.1 hypothetical protein D881_08270 [Corynebacterium ulcerans NCTC 12077]
MRMLIFCVASKAQFLMVLQGAVIMSHAVFLVHEQSGKYGNVKLKED